MLARHAEIWSETRVSVGGKVMMDIDDSGDEGEKVLSWNWFQ